MCVCARQREIERERDDQVHVTCIHRPTAEAKIFLLWEKALSLLLRQAHFVGNHNELVPQFTALATSMIRFGEDKATDGILGVIGLGKKTCYSHR